MIGKMLVFSMTLFLFSSGVAAAPCSVEDSRDFKTYRTLSYGSLNWFAENLRFVSPNVYLSGGKDYFYPQSDILSVCPVSYRVPTAEDWAVFEKSMPASRKKSFLKKFAGLGTLGYYQQNVSRRKVREGGKKAYFQVNSDSRRAMEIDVKKGTMRIVELSPESFVATRCVRDRDLLVENGVEDGKFTDSRNGKSYSVLLHMKKLWMTENMAYDFPAGGKKGRTAVDTLDARNCYVEDSKFCSEFGRYYTWQEAKMVCPSGWHLPSDAEWRDFQKEPKNVNWTQMGRGGCHSWDSYCD
jgi:uncharacterized protein (TIGR02145 family)